MSAFPVPKMFDRPRLFARPSMSSWGQPPPYEPLGVFAAERDEFGLAVAVYGRAPRLSRQYIARCLDFLKFLI